MVPQDSVSSRDTKVEQSTKVAMVCCLYTFHICPTVMMTTESNVLPTTQTHLSVIEHSFFLLFWMVSLAPSLSSINTLSHLPLILYESITDSTDIFVVLSSCMEIHTSYIFLKLVNAVSTSTPLPFVCLSSLERAHKEDSTHHSLANFKQPAVLS